MSKITLTDHTATNDTTFILAVNNNNTTIENAFDNTLSRDGTSPNEMTANLDMNSNNILNLPAPGSDSEPLRRADLALLADITNPTLSIPGSSSDNAVVRWNGTGGVSIQNSSIIVDDNGLTSVFGNQTAGLNSDMGQLTVQTSSTTAYDIYSSVLGIPLNYWDGIRSAVVIPSGTTTINTSTFGAYLKNNNALSVIDTANVGAGVLYWGNIIQEAANGSSWGIALGLNDKTGNTHNTEAGKGLVGIELDFTTTSTNTLAQGFSMLLGGNAQPFSATAFYIGSGGTDTDSSQPIVWKEGYVVANGSATTAIIIGATATSGNNISSMPLEFISFDGAGDTIQNKIQSFNHTFIFSEIGKANYIYLSPAATGLSPSLVASGTDTNIDLTLAATGTGKVIVQCPLISTDYVKSLSTVVSSLPSASTVGAGARAFVTDANSTTFHATVAGGGSNKVPVVSDGTNWLIG